MPGTKTGALTFQYLDATKNTGPLQAGGQQRDDRRALDPAVREPAGQPPERQSRRSPIPTAYSAQGGDIHEVPVPEPATVLAWAGMIGAVALVRRVRKSQERGLIRDDRLRPRIEIASLPEQTAPRHGRGLRYLRTASGMIA